MKKLTPNFPHPHYHSYSLENDQLVDINPILLTRAQDVAFIANILGAKKILDVGSNLGGFLFLLEKFSDNFESLIGIEGDVRFINECKKVAGILNSKVEFIHCDFTNFDLNADKLFDVIILQNIYHYLYDKVGDHEKIFKQFAKFGKSIIWYNPMDSDDSVIPQHANSNPDTNWKKYNRRDIFEGAIKAGFLHPLPIQSRFLGMGTSREHWIFVKDNIKKIYPNSISLNNVSGVNIEIKNHYINIHEVFINEFYAYKIFKINSDQFKSYQKLIEIGFFDENLIGTIRYIVNDEGEICGYSQTRGLDAQIFSKTVSKSTEEFYYFRQLWILISRMIRHDVFSHDIGRNNFVYLPSDAYPILIDLENFVMNASKTKSLSIYHDTPNEQEKLGAINNLKNIFPDVDIKFGDDDPISVLWDCLNNSSFLHRINFSDLLKD